MATTARIAHVGRPASGPRGLIARSPSSGLGRVGGGADDADGQHALERVLERAGFAEQACGIGCGLDEIEEIERAGLPRGARAFEPVGVEEPRIDFVAAAGREQLPGERHLLGASDRGERPDADELFGRHDDRARSARDARGRDVVGVEDFGDHPRGAGRLAHVEDRRGRLRVGKRRRRRLHDDAARGADIGERHEAGLALVDLTPADPHELAGAEPRWRLWRAVRHDQARPPEEFFVIPRQLGQERGEAGRRVHDDGVAFPADGAVLGDFDQLAHDVGRHTDEEAHHEEAGDRQQEADDDGHELARVADEVARVLDLPESPPQPRPEALVELVDLVVAGEVDLAQR